MTLFLGIVAVAVLWWLLNSFAHANTAVLAKGIRATGGILALAVAAVFGVRGRIDMALLLGSLGVWLLGWGGLNFLNFRGQAQRTQGRVSQVRSTMIEMELDHDTGEMDGSVLSGDLAGRRLNSLDEASLLRLLAECRTGDPDGMRLLEAYLDRRFPRWREAAHGNEQRQEGTQSPSGGMTKEEAYKILGLEPGASTDEIRQAHRALMKRLHPDQGGSTYLAARVNQAKEVLLGR